MLEEVDLGFVGECVNIMCGGDLQYHTLQVNLSSCSGVSNRQKVNLENL
jgi:hypothetical protein